MGESLLQMIRQTGIFIVCAQMLLHFRPSEVYGKYIRLLMSMMVLALLIGPIAQIFGKGTAEPLENRVLFYNEALEREMEEAEKTGAEARSLLEKMTLEEVKSQLNKMQEAETPEDGRETPEDGRETSEDSEDTPEEERLVERIEVDLHD